MKLYEYDRNFKWQAVINRNIMDWLDVLKVRYEYHRDNGILNIRLNKAYLITVYLTKRRAVVIHKGRIIYRFKDYLTWNKLVSYIKYRQTNTD